jgi:hypothetical protein
MVAIMHRTYIRRVPTNGGGMTMEWGYQRQGIQKRIKNQMSLHYPMHQRFYVCTIRHIA